jgi:hypothetical protein
MGHSFNLVPVYLQQVLCSRRGCAADVGKDAVGIAVGEMVGGHLSILAPQKAQKNHSGHQS